MVIQKQIQQWAETPQMRIEIYAHLGVIIQCQSRLSEGYNSIGFCDYTNDFVFFYQMSFCIVYLASPRDFEVDGRPRIDILRLSLQRTKQLFPETDIFICHEDYTEEDKQSLAPVKEYIQVDFSGGDEHYSPETKRRKGYLMMCRFFCGQLQRLPQLQAYTHYMRLDDDSLFLEPYITPTRVQELLKYDYVYRTLYNEPPCVPSHSIWDFTIAFLRKERVQEWDLNLLKKTLQDRYLAVNGSWANNVPYNNFHISSIALWNHPLVRRYLDTIEKEGGILKYGWFDASIHGMVVFVLSWFTRATYAEDPTWGYRHNCQITGVRGQSRPRIGDEFFPSSL
jgi:hypothetical protein